MKDRLGGKLPNRSPAAEIAAERAAWLARWQAKLNSKEAPITPYHVMSEFMRVVDPAGAIVTHDSGSPRDQLLPFYRATRRAVYLGWGKSHQLGTGPGLGDRRQGRGAGQVLRQLHGRCGVRHDRAGFRNRRALRHADLHDRAEQLHDGDRDPAHETVARASIRRAIWAATTPTLARDLGGWSERVADPNDVADAILRAKRQTEDGRTCLLEFITSAETAFSRREG